MASHALRIGDLADATETTAPTIRYYEDIGLLPNPTRVGGQRRYGDAAVRRMTFIRRCRQFGFSVEQIRNLLEVAQDSERCCLEARQLAESHLAAIHAKLVELCALERNIAELIEAGKVECGGGPGVECCVLEGLSQPPAW